MAPFPIVIQWANGVSPRTNITWVEKKKKDWWKQLQHKPN